MTVPWQIANKNWSSCTSFSSRKQFTPSFQKTIDQAVLTPLRDCKQQTLDDSARPQRINPIKEPKLSRYNRFLTNYTQRGRLFDRLDKRSWHTCLRSTVSKDYPLAVLIFEDILTQLFGNSWYHADFDCSTSYCPR